MCHQYHLFYKNQIIPRVEVYCKLTGQRDLDVVEVFGVSAGKIFHFYFKRDFISCQVENGDNFIIIFFSSKCKMALSSLLFNFLIFREAALHERIL